MSQNDPEEFDIEQLIGREIGPLRIFPPNPYPGVTSWEDKSPKAWSGHLTECRNACVDMLVTPQEASFRATSNPRTQLAWYLNPTISKRQRQEIIRCRNEINRLLELLHRTYPGSSDA